MTLEQKVQMLLDLHEIQNVASLHEYYHSALMHKEELEAIWAKKTPGVSWTNNAGKYDGLASVKKVYGDFNLTHKKLCLEALHKIDPSIEVKPENYGAGMLWVHQLTTPVIQVAGDGKTAKGVWMSAGSVTNPGMAGDKMEALWTYEKYGIDFVKEDGQWKIWHLHLFVDYYCPTDSCWTEKGKNIAAEGAGGEDPDKGFPVPDIGADFYKGYTISTIPKMEPKPPVPYYTFSETFSY